MRFATSAFAVATLALSLVPMTNAQQNTEPGAVVIAIFDDYPAFRPNAAAEPSARTDLRAIVLERDEMDPDRSLVIVHSEHATPEVLYSALATVTRVPSRRSGANIKLVSAGQIVSGDRIPPSARNALAALIADIQGSEVRPLRGQRPVKHVVLNRAAAAQLVGG